MVKKALFVGINYYATPQAKLNGCIDDTINMRSLLIDAYGYDISDMILLRDDTLDPKFMPTKKNILNALTTLVANSEKNTEFWFHYSGHGANINKGTDSIILPSDYLVNGVIVDNNLYEIFKNAKCRCILLFDSCNSGNIVELPWMYEYKSVNDIVKTNVNNHTLENTEIYMFSGCKQTQTCADIYSADLRDYVGAFTDAFITCIRQKKHETDVLTLYSDVCAYLEQKKLTQVPIFSTTVANPIYTFIREGSKIIPIQTKRLNLSKLRFL